MPRFIWNSVSMQFFFSLVLIPTSFSLEEMLSSRVDKSSGWCYWHCPSVQGLEVYCPTFTPIGGFSNWKTSAAPPLSIQNSKSRSNIFNILVHHDLRKYLFFEGKIAKSSQTLNLNDCFKYYHHKTLSLSFLFS